MTKPEQYEPTEPFEILKQKELNFYLFGLHIQKSKAPLLLNSIFEKLNLKWHYLLCETDDKNKFNMMLDSPSCIGSAVTMPNKIKFMSELDETDEIGAGVGSINTVYTRKNEDGKVLRIGTNTDTVGIRESFLQTPGALEYVKKSGSKPGLVYGGGGASRSAVYALHKFLGCKTVYVVNRDREEVKDLIDSMKQTLPTVNIVHISTPEQAQELEKPTLAVLCVPNFPPKTPEEITARKTLQVFISGAQGAVLEMCYHPVIETQLYKEFQAAGWEVIHGAIAVIYQGISQFVLWSGLNLKDIPVDYARSVVIEDINNS